MTNCSSGSMCCEEGGVKTFTAHARVLRANRTSPVMNIVLHLDMTYPLRCSLLGRKYVHLSMFPCRVAVVVVGGVRLFVYQPVVFVVFFHPCHVVINKTFTKITVGSVTVCSGKAGVLRQPLSIHAAV